MRTDSMDHFLYSHSLVYSEEDGLVYADNTKHNLSTTRKAEGYSVSDSLIVVSSITSCFDM